MPEIGIIITAKDAATTVIKGMGSAAKKSLDGIRSVADKAKASFEVFGKVATGLNTTLELGKKAWGMLQATIGDTILKALEFRSATDPVLKWFEDMKRDTELLRAAIGDALIPVVQGLAEGFGLVGRGARDWVRENRKLMATQVLEWTIRLGEMLTKGVAKAVLMVVRVWKGWEQIILVVKAGAEAMFAGIMSGAAKLIEGMADVVGVFDEDLAQGMLKAAEMARGLGDEFESSSDKSLTAFAKNVDQLQEYENQIDRIEKGALKRWATAHVVAQKTIEESITGTNQKIEEGKKADEDRAKRAIELAAKVDKFLTERHQERIRLADLEEKMNKGKDENLAKMAEFAKERQEKATEAWLAKATAVGDFFESVVGNFAAEQENATRLMAEAQQAAAEGAVDASEKMNAAREAQAAVAGNAAKRSAVELIDMVTKQVAALAVQASAGAFASMASIPVVGPVLGAAAAAAAGAAVMAMGAGLKSLVSMQGGGVVAGGVRGRDSVPAMLMPDEQVMSIPERQAMQKFMTRLLGAQAGQAAIGSPVGQGSGRPVVVNQRTEVRTWMPNLVEETKMARRLENRGRKRLMQQGMLLGQEGV